MERFRPEIHFSPAENWMNDPNGLVYYSGEYHLFYQFHPFSTVWGPMHWGHAISKDLIHWEHQPIALYPDELGYIFSGCIVVDWNNSSGLGKAELPPLVAIFTQHSSEGEKNGRNDFQYQSLAYSLDKGRTWATYRENPIIPNPGIKDFRDPKIVWHQESHSWIMVLAANDKILFYRSKNLINWELISELKIPIYIGLPFECPDLFPLKVLESEETKWVLIISVQSDAPNKGSGIIYYIGDFNGTEFSIDEFDLQNPTWLDYGADNYAFVSWSDTPQIDQERIGIGWMNNWLYADKVPSSEWRGAMTLPRKLSLVKTKIGYRLKQSIVSQLEGYTSNHHKYTAIGNYEIDSQLVIGQLAAPFHLSIICDSFEGKQLILRNEYREQIVFYEKNEQLTIDRSQSGVTNFHKDFGIFHSVNLESQFDKSRTRWDIYVDHSSVECLLNEGELVITEQVFPQIIYDQFILQGGQKEELIEITLSEISIKNTAPEIIKKRGIKGQAP